MLKKASVSVIIPYYNAGATIERAIQSIARQTILPQEVIIVDDCSLDENTNKILLNIRSKFAMCFDIVLLRMENNSGPGSARNRGWDSAKGKYIAFLDADDAWHPQKISIQYNIMKSMQMKFSCTELSVNVKNHSDKIFKEIENENEVKTREINMWRTLFVHNATGTSTVMIERELELRFEENMYRAEDYLLYLKIMYSYPAILVREKLTNYFKNLYGGFGLTQDLWNLEKGELTCFYILAKNGYVPFVILPVVFVWSYIKYLRRVLIVQSRNAIRF